MRRNESFTMRSRCAGLRPCVRPSKRHCKAPAGSRSPDQINLKRPSLGRLTGARCNWAALPLGWTCFVHPDIAFAARSVTCTAYRVDAAYAKHRRTTMSDVVVHTPMQYLDKAVGALRDVGLMPAKIEPAPINAILEKITELDPEKIQVIARTLGQASVFNEIVRDQISGMEIGERYKAITDGFNSIRDDAKRMVDQLADHKLDLLERATNTWMKISRGDIADRFDKVKGS